MPSFVSYKKFVDFMDIPSEIIDTYKAGGSFSRTPLNLSTFVPFMRIGCMNVASNNVEYIDVTRHQLEDRKGDPASNYAYRGTIALQSIKATMSNVTWALPKNFIDISLHCYHPNALSHLRNLFRLHSLVKVDFGWTTAFFDPQYSQPGNVHGGDAMTLWGVVSDFNIEYSDDLQLDVNVKLIDSGYYPLTSINIDYLDLSFFKDPANGTIFSELDRNGIEFPVSDIVPYSPEFLDNEKWYRFEDILQKIAEDVNNSVRSNEDSQIRFTYSEVNSNAKFIFAPNGNSSTPISSMVTHPAFVPSNTSNTIGNLMLSQMKLQDFRSSKEVFNIEDFLTKIFEWVSELSENTIDLGFSLDSDGRTIYIIDTKLIENGNQLASDNVLPLVIGSKDSIIKSLNLGADLGDASVDALSAYTTKFGFTDGYIFSKKDVDQYKEFFKLGESTDNLNYFVPAPNNDYAITKGEGGLSPVNDTFTFVISKKGIDALSSPTPDKILQKLIEQGTMSALKYSVFHGSLVLRGLSGIKPLNRIKLLGTGTTVGDVIYIINSVVHDISARGWNTNLEISMWPSPKGDYGDGGIIVYDTAQRRESIGPVAAPAPAPEAGFPIH